MTLMRANSFEGPLKKGWALKIDTFGPWNWDEQSKCHLGPKKVAFPFELSVKTFILLQQFLRGRPGCAQAVTFSYKPVSNNVWTIFSVWRIVHVKRAGPEGGFLIKYANRKKYFQVNQARDRISFCNKLLKTVNSFKIRRSKFYVLKQVAVDAKPRSLQCNHSDPMYRRCSLSRLILTCSHLSHCQ